MDQLQFVYGLLAAIFLGGLVGLERQITGHSAGVRTYALVCAGAYLFTAFPFWLPNGELSRIDVTRIAAQIVSGVGFLGSGIIFKDGFNVRGINTAATIWCTAATGIFVGAGLYFPAGVAAIFLFVSNFLFHLLPWTKVWNRFDAGGNVFLLRVTCSRERSSPTQECMTKLLSNRQMYLIQFRDHITDEGMVCLEAKYVYTGKDFVDMNGKLMETLRKLPGIQTTEWIFKE